MAFIGQGPQVTNLNADNLASGTVGTARLGSGTANSTTFLRGDQTWATIAAGGGDYVMTTFTSPGTWTKPSGLKAVKVTVVGGGGGGGNLSTPPGFRVGAGGAGGGGAAIRYIPAPSIPGPVSVTIGSGGAGRPSGTSPTGVGTSGGTSSFGAFASATGGAGGTGTGSAPAILPGGAGGVGSSGDLNIGGQGGGGGGAMDSDGNVLGEQVGAGGSSILGGGGHALGINQLGTAPAGRLYGGGGSGASLGLSAGGSGAAGVVIVEEFY
jgi:hypothetical protein